LSGPRYLKTPALPEVVDFLRQQKPLWTELSQQRRNSFARQFSLWLHGLIFDFRRIAS
jgi:hypothetical protein